MGRHKRDLSLTVGARLRFGLAPFGLRANLVKKGHARATGGEILFEFEIPLAAIPLGEPSGEARLLVRRKGFNRLLNLVQANTCMPTRRGGVRKPSPL